MSERAEHELLQQYRTQIPLATKDHYDIKCIVDGTLPTQVTDALPLFGLPSFLESNVYALNSGGRGILLSDGETALRFKGNDVNGQITKTVGNSPKNKIADISQIAQKINNIEFDTSPLDSGDIYHVMTYDNRPFAFLSKGEVEREKIASELMADSFDAKGFFKPYTVEAVITYPQIQWNNESCSTLVFQLPNIESDLRYAEMYRTLYEHLKFATKEDLMDIKDSLQKVTEQLTSWHGFVTGVMEDHSFAPTEKSHQPQNYVLCNISDTEIGASRVDHTSTRIDKEISPYYIDQIKNEVLFFANHDITLHIALALENNNHKLDKERFVSYYDNAMKSNGEIQLSEVPGLENLFERMGNAFNQGYEQRDPIPIPEEDIVGIIQRVSEIQIDEEKLLKQKEFQAEVLRSLGLI